MKKITSTDTARSNRMMGLSDDLGAASTVEQAWSVYSNLMESFGAKSAVYGFFPKTVGRSLSSEVIAMSSHPDEFNRLYLEEGYIDHDPFAQYVMVEDEKSIAWSDPRADRFRSAKSDLFRNAMRDFGVSVGLTIPVRDDTGWRLGGTGISFDFADDLAGAKSLAAITPKVEEAAMLFHARVQDGDLLGQIFSLSPRERECLLWVAAGLTNKEIAFRLSLSDKTVELHIRNAIKRLRARNRTHAVARALIYGVIVP